MNKYQEAKIYKIVNPITNKIYYGSTIEKYLSSRFGKHKKRMSCETKNMDLNDCYIELVEIYPCNNKQDLLWRERFYIENNECINKRLPITTKEEKMEYLKKWNIENDSNKRYYEQRKNYLRKWRENNKKK